MNISNKKTHIMLLILFPALLLLAGCSDLIVRNVEVNWDETSKIVHAEIANVGSRNAGEFLVYFNADENPVSQNRRPQVSHRINGLAAGSFVQLEADFASLAHPDNHNLANVYQISVIADPKNMVSEWNEENNTGNVPIPTPPVVDAHNLTQAGHIFVDNIQWAGQTFTMTQSGRLLGIEVAAARCHEYTSHTLMMEVGQGTTSFGSVTITSVGMPGPLVCNVIAAAPLDLESNGPGYFDYSGLNLTLLSGQTYYFKLTTPTGGDFSLGISGDIYSGGTMIVNGNPSPPHDFAFKVVIQP